MHHLTDKMTEKALQIQDILQKIQPFSELGKRTLSQLRPFLPTQTDECRSYFQKINRLLDVSTRFPDFITALGSILTHFQWIQKTLEDCSVRTLESFELFEIKHFIYFYRKICSLLKSKNLNEQITFYDFDDLFDLMDYDGQAIPAFTISNRFNPHYEQLHEKLSFCELQLEHQLASLRKSVIVNLNLKDFYEKITVSRLNTDLNDRLSSCSDLQIESENFANITYVLKKSALSLDLEMQIAHIKNEILIEEKSIRAYLTQKISEKKENLILSFSSIGDLDLLFAKTLFARNNQGVIPEIIEQKEIFVEKGINLTLKNELKNLNLDYRPIDLHFRESVIVLTGANMAGKTSILKMIGQMAYLCSFGIPVPAFKVSAPLFEFIHYSGPVTMEHRADLSSFALEIVGIQHVIDKKGTGLILIDEFARGTNPEEGEALSKSIIEYFSLHKKGLFVSATHFNPPITHNTSHFRLSGLSDKDFSELQKQSKTYLKENLKEIHKRFSYELIEVAPGSEPPKSAMKIAELLGFSKEILDLAKKYQDHI